MTTICGVAIAAICLGVVAVVDYVFSYRDSIDARTGKRRRG
jgi:hypothetical protein